MLGVLLLAYVAGMWLDLRPELAEYEADDAARGITLGDVFGFVGEHPYRPTLMHGSSRYLSGALCAAVCWVLIVMGRGAMFFYTIGVRGFARAPRVEGPESLAWVSLVVITMSAIFGNTVVWEGSGWF